ncbi:MAG: GAF domain-containing protein [Chloroflexota bacterium]|jgi:K+-sensing histidine kinase KdpD/CheY-like chemotaxis protein
MSGERILVVDDSKEMVKHLTERVLPAFGYKTLHAFDGQTGQKLILEDQIDLVMLDYNLPEMTGLDILRWMAQESISTPVVLMTGYGSELSAIEAFRLGAKDYLIKPFTIDEIVETIDRALVETRLLHDKQELAEQLRRVKAETSRQHQEIETLFNIGKAITSLLNVNKVLERVLEAATELTNAESSMIWLSDENEKETYLQGYNRQNTTTADTAQNFVEDVLVQEVMKKGQPVRKSAFSGDGIRLRTGLFARAVLYVPLKLRGFTMGVLGVTNSTTLHSFSRRDEFLLAFLADYAAIALENSRVFQAADKALAGGLDELNTLIEITRTITSSLDLDEVIRLTIKQVHDSWHIEASSLWLLDEKNQHLMVLANVGTPKEILSKFKVPVGKGFVGHVAQTERWLYTNDVENHPLHYRDVDATTKFETRSILCVPLLSRGRVIGVLQLLNKLNGDFDDQDVERAISIGAAVAIAVTNALLYKEAETRKRHLEVTLEHNDSPILITDEKDRLLLLNQQARSLFNLTEDALGRPIAELSQLSALTLLLLGQTEKAESFNKDITMPDGTIWLPHLATIPKHGRILMLQDITKLRELDKAKDHFVASVSHDMRAPLHSIMGFADGLSDIGPLTQEQTVFVDRIINGAKQMVDVVDGLLELAHIHSAAWSYEAFDLLQLVREVVDEFQVQAMERQIKLKLSVLSKPAGPVQGASTQLRRAISNLIDNAIKYSMANQQVEVQVATESETVLVTVVDEGRGIVASDLPHIFDKFYRGRNSNGQGGVGLGLAVVQSIVQAHNGVVWVESNEKQCGSRFFVRLPFVQPE